MQSSVGTFDGGLSAARLGPKATRWRPSCRISNRRRDVHHRYRHRVVAPVVSIPPREVDGPKSLGFFLADTRAVAPHQSDLFRTDSVRPRGGSGPYSHLQS